MGLVITAIKLVTEITPQEIPMIKKRQYERIFDIFPISNLFFVWVLTFDLSLRIVVVTRQVL